MVALRHDEEWPAPRKRRPHWIGEQDRADARVREDDWLEHESWVGQRVRDRVLYGDMDSTTRIGWRRDDA